MPRHTITPAALLAPIALATLAACSDAPSAPVAPPLRPAAASATLNVPTPPHPNVDVTFWVSHNGGGATGFVGGTTVQFVTKEGVAKTVVDDSADDADKTPGHYRVTMPGSSLYTATVLSAPDAYVTAQFASKTSNAFITPTLASIGKLELEMKPAVQVSVTMNGAPVHGQTVAVTGATVTFSATITDGAASDRAPSGAQDPADGKIYLRLPQIGYYKICPKSAPAPFLDAKCQFVFASMFYMEYGATLTYEPVAYRPMF